MTEKERRALWQRLADAEEAAAEYHSAWQEAEQRAIDLVGELEDAQESARELAWGEDR